MRGLPGSGKSRWVEQYLGTLPMDEALAARQRGYFSTDSFFINSESGKGDYQFQPHRLAEYHQCNLTNFINALALGEPRVICDNTNMARWEFSAYICAAKAMGYQVREVLLGEVQDTAHQMLCAKRNTHGVSLEQIQKMAQNFQP